MKGCFKAKAECDEFVEEFVDDECGCGNKTAEKKGIFSLFEHVGEDVADCESHNNNIKEFPNGEEHGSEVQRGCYKVCEPRTTSNQRRTANHKQLTMNNEQPVNCCQRSTL